LRDDADSARKLTGMTDVAKLLTSALDDVNDPDVPLSAVALKALRVARLRNDWEAQWWLQLEMTTIDEEGGRAGDMQRISADIAPHLTKEEFDEMGTRLIHQWVTGPRSIAADKFAPQGIAELELRGRSLQAAIDGLPSVNSPDPRRNTEVIKGRMELQAALSETLNILQRQRHGIALYLSRVDTRMHFGRVNGDIFERNRQYVETRLREIAPQVLDQFASAYQRHADGDAEAQAHALLSCRRVLKSLADALYPASNILVEGVDGRARVMDADNYLNRLCQFAADASTGSKSRDLIVSNVQALGGRLSALNRLDSKGVHADVSNSEAEQCLIQTFIVVGDLLRIADHESAAVSVV
jgi:hypothetical protein